MKVKWLDRRIAYPGPYLTLCLSEDEYFRAFKDMGVKPTDEWISSDVADATTHRLENDKGQLACIVCLRVKPHHKAVEIAGLLVHEAVHVWQRYADGIGEHTPGREQEAYAIQSISQELLQAYADRL